MFKWFVRNPTYFHSALYPQHRSTPLRLLHFRHFRHCPQFRRCRHFRCFYYFRRFYRFRRFQSRFLRRQPSRCRYPQSRSPRCRPCRHPRRRRRPKLKFNYRHAIDAGRVDLPIFDINR
jgi:hypothetical protein